MMLRLTTSTLLALAGAIPAFAQEGTQDFANQTLSTRSREEVRFELAQARAAGELDRRGQTYGGFSRTEFVSTKTRAQVLAELDVARRNGEFQNRGETYGSFAPAMAATTKSDAQVRADVAQAKPSSQATD